MVAILFVIAVGLFVVAIFATKAAYENGIVDGYGFAKEPSCPGYKSAGEYLRKHMAHRWPELKPR